MQTFASMGHERDIKGADASESDLHGERAAPSESCMAPLVVDLDGTLTPTDTLVESVLQILRKRPSAICRLLFALARGPAGFKSFVASLAAPSVDTIPLNEPLLAYLTDQRDKGRRIHLATAAHRSVADAIAQRVGLFDEVIATEGLHNIKGEAKLAAIRFRVGDQFIYAGDSWADLAVWRGAVGAVLVSTTPTLSHAVRSLTLVEREFPKPDIGLSGWARALRIHQWLKNLLLFVPVLTAGSELAAPTIGNLLLAFFSFSLLASATYLGNDLWDLDSDRAHPRKRTRPLASGALSLLRGITMGLALAGLALALALIVSPAFLALLAAYFALTSAYSTVLKRYVIADVLALACLYTLRIFAGSIVLGVEITPWLLAFSAFLFFSLALVKRCSELLALQSEGRLTAFGRNYGVGDLAVLWPLGVSASVSAVVVLGLFISLPSTVERYASPALLWFVALGLMYWLARVWIKTVRGEMHDDPLVFALTDRGCQWVLAGMVACTIAARFVGRG